jgi:hypothetical protein
MPSSDAWKKEKEGGERDKDKEKNRYIYREGDIHRVYKTLGPPLAPRTASIRQGMDSTRCRMHSTGWWAILDTHGKLLSVKIPAALQFLT